MVAEGFKQTEIGWIPEDWELKNIGSIVKYIKGYPFKSKDYCSDGVRVIRISDTTYNSIKDNGGIYVSEIVAKETFKWRLAQGDLIVSTVGSKPPMYDSMVGKVIYVKQRFVGSLLNQNAVMFKNEDNSLQVLLSNIFNTKRYVEYIELIFRGNANQASITLDELFKFQIALPSNKSEQKAIAEALSDADAWIENLEQCIAKKRLIKKGAMQDLLTPKEDWEVKKLGEVCEITGAGVDKKNNENEKVVTLLNYLDVYRRDYIYKSELNHLVTAPSMKIEQCNILKGDILLTPSSELADDIGITALAMENMQGVVYSYHLYRMRFKIHIDWKFGLYMFKNRFFLNQAEKFAEGSGKRYVIALSKIRGFNISFPKSIEDQTRISTILSDMDNEIESLENKLKKARQIKQGMMQELLTGRVRLV